MFLKGNLEILMMFHIGFVQHTHTHTIVGGEERGKKIIRN